MRKSVFASCLTPLCTIAFSRPGHADVADFAALAEAHAPTLTLVLAGGLPLLVVAGLGSLLIARRVSRPQPASFTQIPMAAPVSRKQITEVRPAHAVLQEVDNPLASYQLEGTMIRIGRHQENDIQLASQTVHRYHAVLHVTPRLSHVLTDLSGPDGNGVLVNGKHVEQIELAAGDVVELGNVKLRFDLNDTF
jgi:Inner membrane component of T3SS, cytoplasmic domain